jgi:hypothetical protein
MVKNKEKPIQYKGNEFSYQAIFDFINVYSETFVFKDSKDEIKSAASKAWNNEQVPMLSMDSANDICLKKDGALCVIYVGADKSAKEGAVDALYSLGKSFENKINRGVSLHFMWVNSAVEPTFAAALGNGKETPRVVILNPGKRKRYLVHSGALNEASISQTIDKILGGDARFTNVKGNKLPELVSSHPTE